MLVVRGTIFDDAGDEAVEDDDDDGVAASLGGVCGCRGRDCEFCAGCDD